jgi:pyrroline-5-carboxylate reductase
MISGDLVLVGAGKMGGALLDGWLAQGIDPAKLVAIEPHPASELVVLQGRGLRLNPDVDSVHAEAIVVAVKPQIAAAVMPTLAHLAGKNTLVLSIMAGRALAFLESALPAGTAVIRTMPNTPAAIGRGIAVAVANRHVTAEQRTLADRLLSATGAVAWIDDEKLMDAVTAVSGSGPAYVFLLTEALMRAGIACGLPAALAEQLARETVSGSGDLIHRSKLDLPTLRKNVTSPGGTTAAALEVLMAPDGLAALMEKAVAAATKRSKELG